MNSIIAERYANPLMTKLFTKEHRYATWREVWLALAIAQKELGLPITDKQLEAAKATKNVIDFDRVAEIEKEIRHDVMAHLKAWGEITPEVNHIMHVGATSCFVTDNAESRISREAICNIFMDIDELIDLLKEFAKKHADYPVVGYTHFQIAQPTTIGKRVALWLQDLEIDYNAIHDFIATQPCRGAKGTTGSQASYLSLFDGDYEKVKKLDKRVGKILGFRHVVGLSSQTLSRKFDELLANILVGVAISLSKIGNDVRLLSHTGDLYEGFGEKQVGSSAMPYKRNPMMAERLCSLSRSIPNYRNMLTQTAMTQWLERSLDDSAIRRVAIPDMFLATSGALQTAIKLVKRLKVGDTSTFSDKWPFLMTETILMDAVKAGHDRQEIHEKLREYSLASRDSDFPTATMVGYLSEDPILSEFFPDYNQEQSKKLTGCCKKQIEDYIGLF